MSASFPNAKKTFSAVVNGVTKLVAALFNTAYDEIEAEQTFIGAMGSTQANTDSLKNLHLGYRRGCSVDYNGAADLYVRMGEIAIPDASGNLRFRRNTADLTVDWSMIDTGSEASSTQYYVYTVADAAGTTFTVKISANATTPTGCTFYKLIGTFYNDASSNIGEIGNLPNLNSYDSGWFDVAPDTTYTKTHNLGTTKCTIEILISPNADGSGGCYRATANYNGGNPVFLDMCSLSATQIQIRSALYMGAWLDASGNVYEPGNPTHTYCRIIMKRVE